MFHGSSGIAGGQQCPTHMYQTFPKVSPPRWSEWIESVKFPVSTERIDFSIPLDCGVASLLFPKEVLGGY